MLFRSIRLLGINTDAVAYNFEQAKQPGRTGWQTQQVGNVFASDLLPGFSLRVTHDLWDGPVGLTSSRFSPFLTNVAASFTITPGTLRSLGSLVGLGGGRPGGAAPAPAQPPAPSPGTNQPALPGFGGVGGVPRVGGIYGGGAGGFSLALAYSSTRRRPSPSTPSQFTVPGGQQQLTMNLTFNPTAHWAASWNTVYDVDTRQFGQHYVRLERDLHRWHASFAFVKSPNGNFAFNFYVSLLDEPDIKFDYEQQSLQR